MPVRYGALVVALIALVAAPAFGEPTPAAAVRADASGCASGGDAAPLTAVRPTDDPATSTAATRALGGQKSLAYHLARAWYLDRRADEFAAMGEFRAAIAAGVAIPQVRVDSLARLPLSVRLYRSGDLAAAREQWQIALGDASAYAEGDGLARCASPRTAALVLLGDAAARRGDLDDARREWLAALDFGADAPISSDQETALRRLLGLSSVPRR
jgi:tetratricopeptide (TPR) repeat protein